MLILLIILSAIATARVTVFFINEDGPLNIVPKFREYLGIIYYPEIDAYMPANYDSYWKSQLAEIFTCPWCLGLYVAAFFVILAYFFPTFALYFSTIFALSWMGPVGQKVYEKFMNE